MLNNKMITIPEKFMGKPIKGSLEKVLKGMDKEPVLEPDNALTTAPDKLDYIFVPKAGVYLAKQRTHLGLNWYKTHKALHQENLRMPTIPEFIEYLNYLKTDYQKQGQEQKQEAEQILDDILKIGHLRANWLDARFEEKGKGGNKKMYIHYNHRTVSGELKPQNIEELLNYLKADCWADIFNLNKQGLPTLRSGDSYKQGENAYFSYPIVGKVSGFGAYPSVAVFGCDRIPLYSNPGLGVFSVCEAKGL